MELNDEIARVAAQEAALRLPRFDEAIAWRLGARLHGLAVERRLDLMTTARIKGDITTETISVEAGAVLEGNVRASGPLATTPAGREGDGA